MKSKTLLISCFLVLLLSFSVFGSSAEPQSYMKLLQCDRVEEYVSNDDVFPKTLNVFISTLLGNEGPIPAMFELVLDHPRGVLSFLTPSMMTNGTVQLTKSKGLGISIVATINNDGGVEAFNAAVKRNANSENPQMTGTGTLTYDDKKISYKCSTAAK